MLGNYACTPLQGPIQFGSTPSLVHEARSQSPSSPYLVHPAGAVNLFVHALTGITLELCQAVRAPESIPQCYYTACSKPCRSCMRTCSEHAAKLGSRFSALHLSSTEVAVGVQFRWGATALYQVPPHQSRRAPLPQRGRASPVLPRVVLNFTAQGLQNLKRAPPLAVLRRLHAPLTAGCGGSLGRPDGRIHVSSPPGLSMGACSSRLAKVQKVGSVCPAAPAVLPTPSSADGYF